MASELELKAVVPDPVALRQRLLDRAARPAFRGMLRDRRLDREGLLTASDQVLRLREWTADGASRRAVLGWKGPTSVSTEGYKHREELELTVEDADTALAMLRALGYRVVQVIDRYVEVFELAGGVARLEWYPRLDVLVELEGSPESIERLVAATGLPRGACLPDSLAAFAARYEARTGRRAVLAESDLAGELPGWAAA